jgi:Zn-dependent peptidase ImmA (M78 family)/DNA-binding XRE family transcriptional regulator
MSNLSERLKLARNRAGLTLDQASERTGIGVSSISEYENGKREPKIHQLAELAKAYHRPFSFFLEEGQVEEESVLWRAKPETGHKEIETRFIELCRRYNHLEILLDDRIETELPVETGDPENYSYTRAEALAKEVRDRLQLGDYPGNSLQRVLEEQYGVKIFFKDFLPDGAALSSKDSFGYGIILNPDSKRWRRNFDLAHELFHLLTWDVFRHGASETSNVAGEWEEKYAQCFAANVLMPSEALKRSIESHRKGGNLTFSMLSDIARLFDVSIDALIWRIHTVYSWGKEREEETRKLIDKVKKAEARLSRRNDTRPPDWPERYKDLAVKALNMAMISTGKFAEYLEIGKFDAMKYIEQEEGLDEEIQFSPA